MSSGTRDTVHIWAVPLAAAEEDGAAQLLSLGLCAYLLRQGIGR